MNSFYFVKHYTRYTEISRNLKYYEKNEKSGTGY